MQSWRNTRFWLSFALQRLKREEKSPKTTLCASDENLVPISSCEDAFLSRGCSSAWPSARAATGAGVTALALGSPSPGARRIPTKGRRRLLHSSSRIWMGL